MSAQGFIEVRQYGPALQTQRLHYGQDALDKTATPFTAAAKTALPPQHRPSQHTLGVIVGRLHTLDKGKRPQRRFPRQQLPARAPRRRAAAAQTATQFPLHVRTDRTQDFALEPLPAVRPIAHLGPILEQHARQRQQVLADPPAYARSLGQGPEIANQMRPTQLSPAVGQHLVDTPAVADHNAGDDRAQQRLQTGQAAAGMDHEGGHCGRGRHPQPATLAGLAPTGLVGVLDLGDPHGLYGLVMGRGQRLAHLFFQVADATQGHRHVKDRLGDLLDAAAADAVAADQVGQGGGQAGAEAVPAQGCGDGGVRHGLACGTGAGMSLIFEDLGGQRRQFGDLMPGRFGVVGLPLLGQGMTAVSAGAGHEGDDLVQAFGWQASLQGGWMPRLAAGLFAGGLFDDGLGRLRRIGGGWQGRVGGVLA